MITIANLRKPKFFKIAIFDLVTTFIAAFIVHLLMWLYPLNTNTIQKILVEPHYNILYLFSSFF